jgi:DHA1 family bicyclomycin/chloramphenicol resistance-like MFS transporter
MTYLLTLFFCCGILFGNFNALALEPLGHIAGIATAVITSGQTFLSVLLGSLIADRYAGDVMPLVAGFTVLGLCAFASLAWAESEKPGPKMPRVFLPDPAKI